MFLDAIMIKTNILLMLIKGAEDKCRLSKYASLFSSVDDHGWVREEIVRFLEDHGYTLCIHTRDFVPTATIQHNISLSIKHSRRMISVLTRYTNMIKRHRLEFSVMQVYTC